MLMKFNIRGSKIEVTDAIRSYIEEKIGRLGKYFEEPSDLSSSVLIKVNGISQTVEVTIPVKGGILRAEDSNKDLYSAIDLVYEKLERQIRKNKTRMNRHDKEMIFTDFEIKEEEIEDGKVVKRKAFDAKPMSEEEAMLQMELLGHEFFIFKDDKTDNVSVIYKRKDKNYGIIEMK